MSTNENYIFKSGKQNYIFKSGKLRGEVVYYPGGKFCTVWYPFTLSETGKLIDEDCGVCFDFDFADLPELVAMLAKMEYEYENHNIYAPQKDGTKKIGIVRKLYDKLAYVSVSVVPFRWNFNFDSKLMRELFVGPIKINW